MRCYHTYVKGFGKVLIPGCMGTAAYDTLDRCTCEELEHIFEKKAYNRILKEKEEYIKILEKEIENLNLIIELQNKA